MKTLVVVCRDGSKRNHPGLHADIMDNGALLAKRREGDPRSLFGPVYKTEAGYEAGTWTEFYYC